MDNPINIDEIMRELQDNIKRRSYPKEAVDFDTVCSKNTEIEDVDFFKECMERDVRYINRSYYVDYDFTITGKKRGIKKFIRRLYQFHMRPMWDTQNCFNLKAASALTQMRNFVLQQMAQNEQMEKNLEELRKICREQELRITQLEKKLSEEKE
ncbi:MAG: hypothetical protein ACLTJE_10720 [Enterocloster bolteae]|uniref:hypothetical protein n=1 Tax=Enterocloster bolteae TaxID=208479 RepID=UPI003995F57D